MRDNYYENCAEQLYENGYEPLPLVQNEKRPAINNWSVIDVDQEFVNHYVNNKPNAGIGLRGGELVAIDIDVDMSKPTVDNLITWCEENIGLPMIRIGNAPKVALFFRTEDPFSLRNSASYGDDPKHQQHVEARSLDMQTVAYGVHPDTGKPYEWQSISTPLNTHIDDLPNIEHWQIDELYEYFDELAESNNWPLQADLMPDSPDSDNWMKGKYEISDVDLIAALGFIAADDYHKWVQVGMSLHHQFDGDDKGLKIWDDWSQKSSKYESDCENKWVTFHDTGKRKTATLGSILHLAAAKGWHNPGIIQPKPDTADIPKPTTLSFIDLIQTTPPVREWLIPDFIPMHKVCMLTAPGGTGKSTWTLQLAFSIATGLPLCGFWDNIEPGGVLILGAEDDLDDAHERGTAILNSFEDQFTDGLDDALQAATTRFHYKPLVGKNVALTYKDGHDMKPTGLGDKIIAYANAIADLRLIVIDPVSRFKGGDENSQEDMTRFIEELERIRTATGATVLIVHHANKDSMRSGGADEQYAARGASALTDGVRWQANMAKMHADEGKQVGIHKEDVGSYVKFAVPKTNYTAPISGVWLQRQRGGALTAFDMDKQKRTRGRIEIEAAHQCIIDVINSTDLILTRNDLKNNYAGRDGKIPVATRLVHGLVDDMVKMGVLKEIASGRSGPSHGLQIVKNVVVEDNEDDDFLEI